MKILVTGATGYLGRELVRQLSKTNEQEVVVVSSNIEKARELFHVSNVKIVSNESLLNAESLILGDQCMIVHAAFCRQSFGTGLAQSLDFSRRLFQEAVECNVKGILNLSSQSVYGSGKEKVGDENKELNPGYLYALAKCAAEELLNQALYFSNGKTAGCNVRLASLMGPTDSVPDNVLYKFIVAALSGNPITIVGGKQKFSFLDVHDAAEAIIKIINYDPSEWKSVYNLGPEEQTDIVTMAELIREKSEEITGRRIEIIIKEDEGHELNTGMDSSVLYKDLQWMPAHSIEDIIKDTIQFVSRYRMDQ